LRVPPMSRRGNPDEKPRIKTESIFPLKIERIIEVCIGPPLQESS